jgi:transcriptional regulator NrdR family protein
MVCIHCAGKTQIINSRLKVRLNQTWRRRACIVCRAIFTTIEDTEYASSWVVKKSAGIQPFLRDKLFISVYESCKHRETALTDANGLTHTIIAKLGASAPNGVIDAKSIIQNTSVVLNRFDRAASSYYEAFHKT